MRLSISCCSFWLCAGPDSQKIYDSDGYTTYLPKKFPKLDYIDRCYVVDEVSLDSSEGEF